MNSFSRISNYEELNIIGTGMWTHYTIDSRIPFFFRASYIAMHHIFLFRRMQTTYILASPRQAFCRVRYKACVSAGTDVREEQ